MTNKLVHSELPVAEPAAASRLNKLINESNFTLTPLNSINRLFDETTRKVKLLRNAAESVHLLSRSAPPPHGMCT